MVIVNAKASVFDASGWEVGRATKDSINGNNSHISASCEVSARLGVWRKNCETVPVVGGICVSQSFLLCLNFVKIKHWAKKFFVEARAIELCAFEHDWLDPVTFWHIAPHSEVQTSINYLSAVIRCCLINLPSHRRNLGFDTHWSHGSLGVHRVSNYSVSFYFYKQFFSEFVINFRLDYESLCIYHSLTRIQHSWVISRFDRIINVCIVEYDESVIWAQFEAGLFQGQPTLLCDDFTICSTSCEFNSTNPAIMDQVCDLLVLSKDMLKLASTKVTRSLRQIKTYD